MDVPLSTAGAIAAAVVALATLILWYVKRRHARSPEQKLDDAQAQVDRLESAILNARRNGNDAVADALRRRLRALQGIVLPERGTGSIGQRDPIPASSGDKADGGK